MLEIKTIIRPIEHAAYFDAVVNSLLIDGWRLSKRDVISLPGMPEESFNTRITPHLYAEMERRPLTFEEVTE